MSSFSSLRRSGTGLIAVPIYACESFHERAQGSSKSSRDASQLSPGSHDQDQPSVAVVPVSAIGFSPLPNYVWAASANSQCSLGCLGTFVSWLTGQKYARTALRSTPESG